MTPLLRCLGNNLPAFGNVFPPDTKSPDSTTSMVSVGPLAARELLKLLILSRQGVIPYRLTAFGRSFVGRRLLMLSLNPSKRKSSEAASEYPQRASPNEDSGFGLSHS